LHTQEWKEPEAATKETTSTLVALALRSGTAESIQIAHERDMALFRDMLLTETDTIYTTLLSERVKLDAITPAEQILSDYRESIQGGRNLEMDPEVPTTSSTSMSSSSKNRLPKKVTTAAAFFGDTKKTTKSSTSKNDDKSAPAKASKTVTKAPKPTSKKNSTSSDIGGSGNVTKDTTVSKKSVAFKANQQDEKENKDSGTNDEVGNADDFVGDLDDDDDDDDDDDVVDVTVKETVEPVVVRENKKKAASNKRRTIAIDDDDDDDDYDDNGKSKKHKEAKLPVTGAMDAFATTSQKSETADVHDDSKPKKRRRKKLVEKTTMDPNGYLHTETQEIWEDVPSDEDEPVSKSISSKKAPPKLAPVTKKKSAANGKSGMKQGNLMGFFKKK
jgi:hypothetical protein